MQFYFAPENTTEYEECNDYIISAYGSKLSYYNAYNAAMDLKDTINEINPSKVGIYALSYGTYFTNTYMQLPGARYDAIVLDGPLPSNRWLMESNSLWNSKVSQDLISLCVKDSSVCRESLDSMGHLPQLLMDSVIDGSLPCLSKLPWLREKGGIDLLRNYNNYMTATKDAQVLIGPFWYRMHRCNDDDAEQLNHFHLMRVEAHKYRSPTYDYSYGLGVNIVASELYTQSSPNVSLTYDDQLLLVSRQFSDGGGQYTNSFARDKSNWPLYQPNLISESFSNTTVPVLILIGTLDPNTQFGLGPWLRDALGKNTLLVEVPYATHGTLTPTDTCVQSIITEFFSSWGESVDTDCTANYVTPDFDGSGKDAQGISMYMFGTADVWNNGYLLDDKPSTSSDCSWKEQDTVFIVFCVTCAVCFASTAIILAVYIHYKKLTKKPLSESKL